MPYFPEFDPLQRLSYVYLASESSETSSPSSADDTASADKSDPSPLLSTASPSESYADSEGTTPLLEDTDFAPKNGESLKPFEPDLEWETDFLDRTEDLLPDHDPKPQSASEPVVHEEAKSHKTTNQHAGGGLEWLAGRLFCHECNRWVDEDDEDEAEAEAEADRASEADSDDSSEHFVNGYERMLNDIIANSDMPEVVEVALRLRDNYFERSEAARESASKRLLLPTLALWRMVVNWPNQA